MIATGAPPSPAALSRRDRWLIMGCIAVVVMLAWAYLLVLDRQMAAAMAYEKSMADMGMDMPWTPSDLVFTFAMWVVMMIGMMAPSAAPVLLLFARTQAGRGAPRLPLAVLAFGLGYAAVWAGFSAAATLAQWGLHDAALLSPAMAAASPYVGGTILIAAGLYQLTPLKRTCLTHCRSPLGFLLTRWRDGVPGALHMGWRHGLFCLGCCWALMALLFVVGVMNLLWVALLTLLVLVEKVGPAGTIMARTVGMAMIVAGMLMAAGVL